MAIVSRKDFNRNVDQPKTARDMQHRLVDEAIVQQGGVKFTPLARLHGVKTEVTYYEQIVSDRQGNLTNTTALNSFDTNLTRFRKIRSLVIITDEIESAVDKDTFFNMSYEGSFKMLPNSIIPNLGDYFVMKVFNIHHIFRIIEINPILIEKDSGYEVRYDMWRQDILPEATELDQYVKEDYSFDYNHVGTEFRTVFKTEESEFIQLSRNVMKSLTDVHHSVFYHKTLNTIMCETGHLPIVMHDKLMGCVFGDPRTMIGSVVLEGRSLYDPYLINFIIKHELLTPSERVFMITQHVKIEKDYYLRSLFSALEHRDIGRLKNPSHKIMYMNSNLYNATNQIYGRFLVLHDIVCDGNCQVMDLYPVGFVSRLMTYNSDTMLNTTKVYTDANDIFIDIISCFLNEKIDSRRITIIIKLMRILSEKYINYMYDDDFTDSYQILYTYPIMVYVLKYVTREISSKEFS